MGRNIKTLPSLARAGICVLQGAPVYSHSERSESCKVDGECRPHPAKCGPCGADGFPTTT